MVTNKPVVNIYTESTPNPKTMKFVLNRMVLPQSSADFPTAELAEKASPLAHSLFKAFTFVDGVFIMNNFVTVTKNTTTEWYEVIPELREFIRTYVGAEKEIINQEALAELLEEQPGGDPNQISADDSEIVTKIKELLKKYVQPAVEMDGGTIVFRSYKEGIVQLGMQGACSGCPSSTVTLKAGIEGLLKRMVPEVKAVEAEAL